MDKPHGRLFVLRSLSLLLVLSWFAARGTRAENVAPSSELAASSAPDDVERARILFKQGVELARALDFANAASRFREALALRSAPAVQYNLAAALSQLGEHAEAFNLCQEVVRSSDAQSDVQEHCQKLLTEITPLTARLTVLASSGSAAPAVAIDGVPLPDEQLGIMRAVAPGEHRVTAERNQERIFEREVSIPLGSSALVNVSLIVTEHVVVQKQVVEMRPDARKDQGADDRAATKKRRVRLWVSLAASAVAVGAGVAVAVLMTKPEPKTEAPVPGSLNPGVLTWK